MQKKSDKTVKKDSISARCSGLEKKIAIKALDNSLAHANFVIKSDGPFYCSVCLSNAVVRKCTEKVDHFAHQARQSPLITKKDQQLHNQCRDEICDSLKKIFPNGNWGTERKIPANCNQKENKERIPDISGRIDNMPIAIEVQASAYTLNKIYEKTVDYYKLGIYVLWVLPLKEDLGTEPFRPRLFEKYLHSMYFGRVYYYTVGNGSILQPVHYSPAKRYIEQNEWYEEGGEQRIEGGYYLTYKSVKSPNYAKAISIEKDFKLLKKNLFLPKNVKKEVPECLIFLDKLDTWWEKNEFRDMKQQIEVIKKQKVILENYDYTDEYDDYEE